MIDVAKSIRKLDENSRIFAEARIEMHLLTVQRSYDALANIVVKVEQHRVKLESDFKLNDAS